MTTRTLVLTTFLLTAAGFAQAQSAPRTLQPPRAPDAPQAPVAPRMAIPPPAAPPAPAAAPAPPAPRKMGQPVNIKVEFTLTDQHGASPATKRTVSMVVADGMSGRVRSQSEVTGMGVVPLNIDTDPELLSDGKIRLRFTLSYDWPAAADLATVAARGTVMRTTLNDSVALILESGKPMVAAQSADPIGDRQVTVEVKATILR